MNFYVFENIVCMCDIVIEFFSFSWVLFMFFCFFFEGMGKLEVVFEEYMKKLMVELVVG